MAKVACQDKQSSALRECSLTLRSRRGPTASHQARATGTEYIICGPGLASCRWSRLNSNVRPHMKTRSRTLRVRTSCCLAIVAMTASTAALAQGAAASGIWRYKDRAAWVQLAPDGRAYQCRVDR